jgi:hypothetical protein
LLYRQSTALSRREMVSRFQVFERGEGGRTAAPDWDRQNRL